MLITSRNHEFKSYKYIKNILKMSKYTKHVEIIYSMKTTKQVIPGQEARASSMRRALLGQEVRLQ